MASISKEMKTKDGRRYFIITVSRGRGNSPYRTRWYRPQGLSDTVVQHRLETFAGKYETECKGGKVLLREDRKAQAAAEAAEAAKIQTVKQYGDKVFMPAKELTISENTRTSYRSMLDLNIYPSIGSVLMTDITPTMCRKVLADYQREHAHSSVIKLYVVMNLLFDMAFQDDVIPISPMLKVKRPAPKASEEKKEESEKAYSDEEIAYILDCVDKEPLKWKLFFYIMNDTGMRRGEVCGLQWSDIDFDEGIITVRHNIQYTTAEKVKDKKTGKIRLYDKDADAEEYSDKDIVKAYDKRPKNGKTRPIDFDKELITPLLKEWHLQTPSKWVFPREDDLKEPMFPQDPNGFFRKFAETYGIDGFHPHKIRHSTASRLIRNGADIASVSERLGHSDKAVTLRMYVHSDQEGMKKAGQIGRDAIKAAREKLQAANAGQSEV